MKNRFVISSALLILILISCAPKEYFYYYEIDGDTSVTAKKVPYNPNNFRVKFELYADTTIIDKDKTVALSGQLLILGEHQFYPKI